MRRAALLAILLPFAAMAHDYQLGDLTIAHPVSIATPATARTGAGYMAITNTGTTADTLVGVEAEFPMVTIHTTQTTDDGVTMMIEIDRLDIAPGETVRFAPGGLHVMFMGLAAPFDEGMEIPATLIFETAGRIEVTFNVESRAQVMEALGGEAMDHGAMDHSN